MKSNIPKNIFIGCEQIRVHPTMRSGKNEKLANPTIANSTRRSEKIENQIR